MKKHSLSAHEIAIINEGVYQVRRKLASVVKTYKENTAFESPVTLSELYSYINGIKPIPLCHLASIFQFYGVSPRKIEKWNAVFSIIMYRKLQKARLKKNN